MLWQLSQKEKPVTVNFGLDSLALRQSPQPAPSPSADPRSSLDMIHAGAALQAPVPSATSLTGGENPRPVSGAAPQAARPGNPQPAVSVFTEAVRRSEAKAQALAIEYTERYPAIHQYGQDWMSKPDLKKLNDDYMVDRDPVRFLRGLAGARSFPELTAKYARDPAVQAFFKEALKETPRELLAASADLLVEDGVLRALLSDTGQALGLPQSFTEGLKEYGKTSMSGPAQPAR